MAKVRRFSGDLKLELSFNDRSNAYQVRICPTKKGEGSCERVKVGAPKHITRAVDSALSYDKAAHAAISFASDRIQSLASTGSYGWQISRPNRRHTRRK